MRDFFTLDGISSADYNTFIATSNMFNSPERDVEEVEIPGRNGNLIFDNGRFKNFMASINCYIPHGMKTNVDALRGWLLSVPGYRRYEDSMHPGYYWMARYAGGFELETSDRAGAAMTLTFDCKPQRFIQAGDVTETWPQHSTVYNPTHFNALPLIRVYGIGNFTLNGVTMNVSYNDGQWLTIDCETQNAYRGTTNCNNLITYDFPILSPGENALTHNFHIFEMTPRFWTL